MALHADAIAQDRAAGERAGGVDGDDADRFLLGAIVGRQAVHQRALAGARRAGDADAIGASGVGKKLLQELFGLGRTIFDRGHGPRKGPNVAGANLRGPLFDGRRHLELPRSWRAITRRWISLVPSPMVQSFTSR